MNKDNLDLDTRRLLELSIDDILFREANKWVARITNLDFVPTEEARRIFPRNKEKSLADEVADAMTNYREERMRYSGIVHHYQVIRRDYEAHKSENTATADNIDQPPIPQPMASADLGKWMYESLLKLEKDVPRLNFDLAIEYLQEGRKRKILSARSFLAWVDKALLLGGLKEGEGLHRKLTECRNERLELESDYQELTQEYTRLDADYSRLEWEYNALYFQSHVRPNRLNQ